MQYAIVKVGNSKGEKVDRLIDANELQTLELHAEAFTELPFEEKGDFYVVYGVYWPQPGTEPGQALEDLLEARDHWLGHVSADKGYGIAFHDVEAYVYSSGYPASTKIPFSAVIQAPSEVITKIGAKNSVQAVTAFLRLQHDMTALDNIFNRSGLMAFKGIERRQRDEEVSLSNWKTFADPDRAARTAQRIF
ncbi:hypothetical protein [Pseudomonas syringae pv. coryli]|uniref:hypothetical protein n=1 Tax=Pseudomonas syringae pv. coryli TaxID=317659 RepID=UPI003D2DFDC6